MSKLVDLLNTKKPADSKAKTAGIDKTPIGTEFPFQNSKDLVKSDLSKARYGELGNKSGGYTPSKKYTDTVIRK
jgi:hypothetical protein